MLLVLLLHRRTTKAQLTLTGQARCPGSTYDRALSYAMRNAEFNAKNIEALHY
ncbi:MAG: hypothetical protein IPP42_06895 [Saprospiraceae bacterium]|nr:hypothetical protein [Saprospiraceae bacterium]